MARTLTKAEFEKAVELAVAKRLADSKDDGEEETLSNQGDEEADHGGGSAVRGGRGHRSDAGQVAAPHGQACGDCRGGEEGGGGSAGAGRGLTS